ncbi:unnamed protein product [Gadus morhua 'NCC']
MSRRFESLVKSKSVLGGVTGASHAGAVPTQSPLAKSLGECSPGITGASHAGAVPTQSPLVKSLGECPPRTTGASHDKALPTQSSPGQGSGASSQS